MNSTDEMLFRYIPQRISKAIHSLPEEIYDSINEIRLRLNSPLSITARGRNIFLDATGKICRIEASLSATREEMEETLSKLTKGSLYTCDEYLEEGFIPLAEGGRAGVCGKAIYRNGRYSFYEITSIDLRIHRNIPLFASPLIEEYRKGGLRGTIVCSPPGLGKTTLLRSAAYMLSSGIGIKPTRVAVADERCEISLGMGRGIIDMLSGIPKARAIAMLTRTMAPEVIICDEISAEESQALIEAQNTGVCLIASAHCRNPGELAKRGRMKEILEREIFPLCVLLDYRDEYICNIGETKDYL